MAATVGPIVVGTDFSETSGIALTEAHRLAALIRAPVQVIHVVDGAVGGGWSENGLTGSWLRAAGLEPDELVIRFGSPWVELARFAAEVAPTLIVVGSHGTSGYQPLSLGSTASRVSMHARCAVALVSPRVLTPDVAPLESRRSTAVRDGAAAGDPAQAGPITTERGSR